MVNKLLVLAVGVLLLLALCTRVQASAANDVQLNSKYGMGFVHVQKSSVDEYHVLVTFSAHSTSDGQTSTHGRRIHLWLASPDGSHNWELGASFISDGTKSGSLQVYVNPNTDYNVHLDDDQQGGALENQDAVYNSGAVTRRICVRIPANASHYGITYKLLQDGAIVATYNQMPGAGAQIWTQQVPSGSDCVLIAQVQGLNFTDGSWVEVTGGVVDLSPNPVGHATPTTDANPTPGDIGVPNVPTGTPANTGTPNLPVWSSSSGGSSGSGQSSSSSGGSSSSGSSSSSSSGSTPPDLLTNAVYREGVTKLYQQKADRDAAQDEKLKPRDDYLASVGFQHIVTTFSRPDNAVEAAVKAQVSEQQAYMESALGERLIELTPQMEEAVGLTSAGGGAWPTFTFPLLGAITFDPYRFPWVKVMLLTCREVALWFFVYAFVRDGFALVRRYVFDMAKVPQAALLESADSQVPIWATIKERITAVTLMLTIVAFYGGIVGLVSSKVTTIAGWAIGSLGGKADALMGDVVAMGTPIVQVFYDFFPFGAVFSLLVGTLTLEVAIWPLALGCQGVVKIIKG